LESTVGVGTAFTVWLPKGSLEPEHPVTPRPSATGSGVIMVVEDEQMVREVLESALIGLGYQVVSAVDGEDALRVYQEHRHRVTGVILDLKMPKKGGVEVFREIRALDPQVPVLICSGYGDNEEAQGLISQGARGLLAKPFHMSELAARLADLR
jgi:two-component system cell cycle sensor histidine kinase/response regulator CckA